MRISILSNAPWAPTGYGNQIKTFAPRIKALGHEVSIQAFYGHEGSPINWNGIQIYGRGFNPYGQDIMAAHASNFHADCILTLMDAWVINAAQMGTIPWVPWFPVDHEPCPPGVLEAVNRAHTRIVYSKFAVEMMHRAGLDCEYVPHGVDTELFKPLNMKESREKARLPQDKFIVGMVAANKGNPPRKAFYQNISAFAELQKRRKDCVLYLHTYDGTRGGADPANLVEYCRSIGLKIAYAGQPDTETADVIFAEQYTFMLGYPDEFMASIYSAMDVHLLVSMGEGFGIPILEAQACGVPVIVGNWTSMGELCFSGWKVDKRDTEPFFTPLGAWQFLPHVDAIYAKLEGAYTKRGNHKYREAAREGAMAYDADLVTSQYWKPVLERLEKKLAPAEVEVVNAPEIKFVEA